MVIKLKLGGLEECALKAAGNFGLKTTIHSRAVYVPLMPLLDDVTVYTVKRKLKCLIILLKK